MRPGPSGPKRSGWRDVPHPTRLAPDRPDRAAILDRHHQACALGLSTYLDPATGFSVMTADYLAERGYCCSQGCRHCPWEGADQEPEPDGPPVAPGG